MLDALEADMREQIISLAEENQKLKAEIEKIKPEKIDNLQKENKDIEFYRKRSEFYRERAMYWRKNWEQVLIERNELAKKVRIYRRLLKHE